jgi:hypothetical protein
MTWRGGAGVAFGDWSSGDERRTARGAAPRPKTGAGTRAEGGRNRERRPAPASRQRLSRTQLRAAPCPPQLPTRTPNPQMPRPSGPPRLDCIFRLGHHRHLRGEGGEGARPSQEWAPRRAAAPAKPAQPLARAGRRSCRNAQAPKQGGGASGDLVGRAGLSRQLPTRTPSAGDRARPGAVRGGSQSWWRLDATGGEARGGESALSSVGRRLSVGGGPRAAAGPRFSCLSRPRAAQPRTSVHGKVAAVLSHPPAVKVPLGRGRDGGRGGRVSGQGEGDSQAADAAIAARRHASPFPTWHRRHPGVTRSTRRAHQGMWQLVMSVSMRSSRLLNSLTWRPGFGGYRGGAGQGRAAVARDSCTGHARGAERGFSR